MGGPLVLLRASAAVLPCVSVRASRVIDVCACMRCRVGCVSPGAAGRARLANRFTLRVTTKLRTTYPLGRTDQNNAFLNFDLHGRARAGDRTGDAQISEIIAIDESGKGFGHASIVTIARRLGDQASKHVMQLAALLHCRR